MTTAGDVAALPESLLVAMPGRTSGRHSHTLACAALADVELGTAEWVDWFNNQ